MSDEDGRKPWRAAGVALAGAIIFALRAWGALPFELPDWTLAIISVVTIFAAAFALLDFLRAVVFANRESPSDEELAYLERKAKRWELKYYVVFKALMSPTVAAAMLGLFGAALTAYLTHKNVSLQAEIEEAKQENVLIIEILKADPTQAISRLKALVNADLLPVFGKKLQRELEQLNQNRTVAPPN